MAYVGFLFISHAIEKFEFNVLDFSCQLVEALDWHNVEWSSNALLLVKDILEVKKPGS